MASGAFLHGLRQSMDGTYTVTTATLKLMLVNNTFVFSQDYTVVDDSTGSTTSLHAQELVATGYTGGFGGAGRVAQTIAISEDTVNQRVVLTFTSTTWNALGGATNGTVGGAALIRESGNDTTSVPIFWFAITATPTNGSNFTLSMNNQANGGNVRFNC